MVLENQPLPFAEWIRHALLVWVAVASAFTLSALALGFFFASLLNGPGKGGDQVYRLLSTSFFDLIRISPRRVFALARLAVQESFRQRVWVVLGIFGVILAFSLWFLNTNSRDPARGYIDFVLTCSTLLALVMALLLSAFSLPNDIKNRTIHTIVTKPVLPSEIVLGRIIGFATVGTVFLAVMCLVSYMFVARAVNHTHELSPADLTAPSTAEGESATRSGRTSTVAGHRHLVHLDADGNGETETERGHSHRVTNAGTKENPRYVVGKPEGLFHAREPIYGKLSFLNRAGEPVEKGISVGDEWVYRSFIDGGTAAAAIWKFQGLREQDFPDGLRMNLTIAVFRSHKGNIEETVLGSFYLRNPHREKMQTQATNFFAKEFTIDEKVVPLEVLDSAGNEVKLFGDIIEDGEVEVVLTCLQGGQYFGMAEPDLYMLPRESTFQANFVKGYITIWLQMVLVTAIGVMWSTFLNGAVAMLATAGTVLGGFFISMMQELANGTMIGGGPFEASYRIVKQKSITGELDEGLTSFTLQALDWLARLPMWVLSHLLPDLRGMSDISYVAEGFSIPNYLLAEQTLMTLGFVVPLFIIGFMCLKTREVAQ